MIGCLLCTFYRCEGSLGDFFFCVGCSPRSESQVLWRKLLDLPENDLREDVASRLLAEGPKSNQVIIFRTRVD